MNINLDEKRIRKIIYTLEDGNIVAYNFRNGEIWCTQDFGKIPFNDDSKSAISDTEMIDTLKNSTFMDELDAARKRFKVAKEIGNEFPQEDEVFGSKNPKKKYSDESLEAAKKIIKMDENGELDEIIRRKNNIDKYIIQDTESEEQYDSFECAKNIGNIEHKILRRLRNSEDIENDNEFNKLIENYKFYKTKKKELDNKIGGKNKI